ncbi:HAL/PAL/TAL family ammonia-lyase [Propionivibrio soli]|uniref:HAL/PAL/TAL family ammonia-lyase n=1 Tax=Propionivibrio soli TaxID=2976531 RepID=UPI0021E7129F|nr:aromatic amino acid ammonia-lyase [Propionivibrio soli]
MDTATENHRGQRTITVGEGRLRIEDVLGVARGTASLSLSKSGAFRDRIVRGASFLAELLANDGVVYGVTTGYGDSCTVAIPPELVAELPLHLTRYHGCGLGEYLDDEATLAVLVCRLNSLAQGYSGVRYELLEQLAALIRHRVLPFIPAEGSIGASGDLTPLSYVAAALIGEREVRFSGRRREASVVLDELGLRPLRLAPKEGLAIMNGTAVMTALACIAWKRADYLTQLCCRLTALSSIALRGNRGHFDPRLFAAKPHAGQNEAAAWIFADLHADEAETIRLQDRYSIRCAPHVIGVARDALGWMRRDIENELNSANDNPLIDSENGLVLHGGHFYGGHIAFAMDALKNAVANLADLMDRQLALLVDSKFNHGLPQNLSGSTGTRAAINHGFKAVQIGASAWTAEALKLTMPASVFSRSTECHNQDKVSMGTIAARDCLRVLQLTEQVAAALVQASVQAVQLRIGSEGGVSKTLMPQIEDFIAETRAAVPFLDEDRPLEFELRRMCEWIKEGKWVLYEND